MTRIFKSYGDLLGPTPAPGSVAERAVLYKQVMALRGVMLLVRLTGQYIVQYIPQVYWTMYTHTYTCMTMHHALV